MTPEPVGIVVGSLWRDKRYPLRTVRVTRVDDTGHPGDRVAFRTETTLHGHPTVMNLPDSLLVEEFPDTYEPKD